MSKIGGCVNILVIAGCCEILLQVTDNAEGCVRVNEN